MPLATTLSRAPLGIDAPLVTVEVHLSNGLPSVSIVGLPETAVKESKDRVRSAILTCGFEFPARRITINLAPADLPKEGGRFDLAIALGILAASQQLPDAQFGEHELIGELALSGSLRPVSATLPTALQCRNAGRALMTPLENAEEAALAAGINVLACRHLLDVCAHLRGEKPITPHVRSQRGDAVHDGPDLSEVCGQDRAKRALEVAAAGGHNVLLIGPPGTGKTMLASRMPGLLPAMTEAEALETATVRSICGTVVLPEQWRRRPFRSPHHSASAPALVGGGNHPRPGEISLAHNGVLFLDELPEFDRRVLEVLRQPLESGTVTISRAAYQAEFPAGFQLIAAMNPCPCGYLGEDRCRCTPTQLQRYRARVSGPLLDRIDLHLEVPRPPTGTLQPTGAEERSAAVRQRVVRARAQQFKRGRELNARMSPTDHERHCALTTQDRRLLEQAMTRLRLSARAYHRILRVARTIADLQQSETIQTPHLSEAIGYRALDRADVTP